MCGHLGRGIVGAASVAAFVATTACQHPDREPQTILVSAATSLAEAIDAVAVAYERHSGTRVLLNIGGSDLLATQLIEGAPVDVFLSADARQMDRAQAAGRIRPDRRVDLLSNQLVVVVPSDRIGSVTTASDLASSTVRRIALGDPETVPAGVYARAYLETAGLWLAVESKVVPTRNVRAALAAVESGTVDAAVVYRTDAATSSAAVVAYAVPRDGGPTIVYPAAVATDAPNEADAIEVLGFLQGPEARRLFEDAGFVVLPQTPIARVARPGTSTSPRTRNAR